MFGLGLKEIVVILAVALLVFGPQKLPEIAKTLGKTLGGLRRALDDLKRETNFSNFDLEGEEPKARASVKNTETAAIQPVEIVQIQDEKNK